MRLLVSSLVLGLATSAFAAESNPILFPVCPNGCITPVEAVTLADQVAPKAGVYGDFELTVKVVGEDRGRFYLNSEEDYRDRNCLTIALSSSVAEALADGGGLQGLKRKFEGKRIVVSGMAKRVRIDFLIDGKPSGKYYYQVHAFVGSPQQITFR
jgi:hypothetical protein